MRTYRIYAKIGGKLAVWEVEAEDYEGVVEYCADIEKIEDHNGNGVDGAILISIK